MKLLLFAGMLAISASDMGICFLQDTTPASVMPSEVVGQRGEEEAEASSLTEISDGICILLKREVPDGAQASTRTEVLRMKFGYKF